MTVEGAQSFCLKLSQADWPAMAARGTLRAGIELLPEALVVAAQMAKESWGLPLPILGIFAENGGGELLRHHPDMLRIMSHCLSKLSLHAPTLMIKIWLVMSHAA